MEADKKMELIDTLTDTLTPVNCAVCGRVFEVFAGSVEYDEDIICDTCQKMENEICGE
jgi:hypothetical protein